MTHRIAAALEDYLGRDAGVGCQMVTDDCGLTPEEDNSIARAVPKRRAEFAAGRRAARMALGKLGCVDASMPMGADRAPVWPEGFSGSITHDEGLALAAIVPQSHALSVGVDLTRAAPLPAGTRDQILRHPDEMRFDGIEARAIFSAKETLFKTLFPFVGSVFGFSAAVVEVDEGQGKFSARLTENLGSFSRDQSWSGHLSRIEGRILTALVLKRDAAPQE